LTLRQIAGRLAPGAIVGSFSPRRVTVEIRTERLEIPVGDARMGAYLARPKEDSPRPGVIVWMEIFGVNAHIRDVT
jgi:hypothetical protein